MWEIDFHFNTVWKCMNKMVTLFYTAVFESLSLILHHLHPSGLLTPIIPKVWFHHSHKLGSLHIKGKISKGFKSLLHQTAGKYWWVHLLIYVKPPPDRS